MATGAAQQADCLASCPNQGNLWLQNDDDDDNDDDHDNHDNDVDDVTYVDNDDDHDTHDDDVDDQVKPFEQLPG